MKLKTGLLFLTVGLLLSACNNDDSNTTDELLEASIIAASSSGKTDFILPVSNDFSQIPQDPKNPLTDAKVELGKLLYHETGLALNPMNPEGEGTYSCASCHFAAAGFQANRHQGISDGGLGFENRIPNPSYDFDDLDVQPIRTPSAMNGAYQINNLWNGQFGATGLNVGTEDRWTTDTPIETNELGYEGLETQAIAGLTVHRLVIDEDFLDANNYKALFDAAFPDIDEDYRYDREYAGLAIAAYERTLLSNGAPFQNWLKGDNNAMTEQQKLGAIAFFEKGQCASCHNGPALNSMEFHALGMKDLFENSEITYGSDGSTDANLGRGGFTGLGDDLYKFKVPQLYNLKDSPFYGHGASFTNVRDLIAYKNAAVKENDNVPDSQLAAQFKSLGLTETEMDNIAAFISEALYDPNLARYEPASVNSGACIPNNDPVSRVDLGCD